MNPKPPGIPPDGTPLEARRPRSLRLWIGVATASAVALLAGVAIGAAVGNNSSALSSANRRLATTRNDIAKLQARVGLLKARYASEKVQAQQATSIADSKASAAYAQRSAALNRLAKSLRRQQKALAVEEGTLRASQIRADGVYVVGRDVKPGIWHTSGDGGVGGYACYFATLNSTNTSDIADNNNFDGAETVDLNGVYAFQISGPCTWVRTG